MSTYASHLTALQSKTDLIASEDILTEQGVLIAKSGTRLNEQACQNVLKFKLLKPLEDSIFLANQLSAKAIFEQIVDLINRDAYLKALNAKVEKKAFLQKCCIRLQQYPLLLQKLTVLDMELTDVFRQSLLSAYLAALCAVIEGRDQSTTEEYFLAGIIHDIGYLHIERQILLKQGALETDEWRKVQSHPVIAYEILKGIPNFPKKVSRAVLEHHENLDGSGYPRAKTVHDLGNLGQLINLLDNVIVIYNKKFKPLKRSLKGIIPIIQINMHSYLPKEVSSIFKLLKLVPDSPPETSDKGIIRELITFVQNTQNYIKALTNGIQTINEKIGFTHQNKQLYAIQNIAINILVITNSAGLGNDNLDWIEQLDSDGESSQQDTESLYKEVEDTRLMQGEIIFQLQSYQKAASVFIKKNPNETANALLNEALDFFAKNARPPEPNTLKDYWQTLAS